MLFIISVVMSIVVIGLVANNLQEKDRVAYRKYMLELDEMKKRKKARND